MKKILFFLPLIVMMYSCSEETPWVESDYGSGYYVKVDSSGHAVDRISQSSIDSLHESVKKLFNNRSSLIAQLSRLRTMNVGETLEINKTKHVYTAVFSISFSDKRTGSIMDDVLGPDIITYDFVLPITKEFFYSTSDGMVLKADTDIGSGFKTGGDVKNIILKIKQRNIVYKNK